ncbi:MAG: 4Fe-4S binding protein [Candidatus Woesearchaeota archaeon]
MSKASSKLQGVDQEKCVACGKCVEVCNKAVFEIVDKKGKIVSDAVNIEKCDNCGQCIVLCGKKAIKIKGAGSIVSGVLASECDGCEKCVAVCPEHNLIITEQSGKFFVQIKNKSKCQGDHYCAFVCEKNAIKND